MFNHSKKNRKNRKNVTKNNIKKIKKKYDTRKVKVKNVKKTRKNLVGGKPPAFITLLEDSFKQYKSISKNQTPLLEKIPDKKDNSLSFIKIKNTDLRSYHIHYGKNFMGFPSGNGGRTNQGEKLIEDNNPTFDDVIDAIKTWETLVNNDQANNTEWQKLFDIMKTKVTSERHKYIFSTNLRNDQSSHVSNNQPDDIRPQDDIAEELESIFKNMGLKKITQGRLCNSTITNLKNKHETYDDTILESIESQIKLLENHKIPNTRQKGETIESNVDTQLRKAKQEELQAKLKEAFPELKHSLKGEKLINKLKPHVTKAEDDYRVILHKFLLYKFWCMNADKFKHFDSGKARNTFIRGITEKVNKSYDKAVERGLIDITLKIDPIEYLVSNLATIQQITTEVNSSQSNSNTKEK